MKLLKTQQDKEEFLFWIATLQSGVFEKGITSLQASDNAYCCLGVGVICTVPESDLVITPYNVLAGYFPDDRNYPCPDWLKDVNHDFFRRTGRTLADLNDDTDLSHAQIADNLLEAYKEELS